MNRIGFFITTVSHGCLTSLRYNWIVITCLTLLLPLCAEDGEQWPHYLGPNYDLRPAAEQFTKVSATEVWKATVATAMSSVSIADGRLYTMGNDGKGKKKDEAKDIVYCLDAGTGKELWRFGYSCPLDPRQHPGGPGSTPTIHEGKVYTLSKFGHIHCLDARTGEKIWEASAEHFKPQKAWWGFAASPTVIGSVVIYNIGERGLALNKDTGKIIWESSKSVVAYATPKPLPNTMFNRSAVALFTNENLLILDPSTGQSIATYTKSWQEESNCNAITPYLHNGHLYLVHSAHGLARLSLKGEKLTQDWLSEAGKYPNEWFAFNPHVIYDNNIYFLTKGNKSGETGLHCVDAVTGKQKWIDTKVDFGNPLIVDNMMIMLSEAGELICGTVSDTQFNETYRQKILEGLCWSNPVPLGNFLYARDTQGTVICLKLE